MTDPLLTVRGLTKQFTVNSGMFGPGRILRAVDGIDLTLYPGETLGLAGESGCGKSTVARLIMGLLPPTGGSILFAGAEVTQMGKAALALFRKNAQIIFQDPFSSLNPRMRVGEIIGEPLAIHGLATKGDMRGRVLDIMRKVGLAEEHYHRYPHEFSGGQRQRIGIARAVAVSPRLIVADEPVSALDLSIQAQIINLLQDLKEEFALSFLFIAHDLSVVRHLSDRIAIMYLGKIVESASRDAVFDHSLHPYTEALLAAVPHIDFSGKKNRVLLAGDIPSPLDIPAGCPFHPRCPHARIPLCSEVAPLLEEKEPGHAAACHFSHELYR
jgi:peptide/nickel transport system ATP-binding protein